MSSPEAERKVRLGLMRMSDDEIDRLCETLHALRLTAPFFGTWRTIAWEAVGWFVKQFPLVARDWDLLERRVDPGGDQLAAARFVTLWAVGNLMQYGNNQLCD